MKQSEKANTCIIRVAKLHAGNCGGLVAALKRRALTAIAQTKTPTFVLTLVALRNGGHFALSLHLVAANGRRNVVDDLDTRVVITTAIGFYEQRSATSVCASCSCKQHQRRCASYRQR